MYTYSGRTVDIAGLDYRTELNLGHICFDSVELQAASFVSVVEDIYIASQQCKGTFIVELFHVQVYIVQACPYARFYTCRVISHIP